jgi:hypothetical protein
MSEDTDPLALILARLQGIEDSQRRQAANLQQFADHVAEKVTELTDALTVLSRASASMPQRGD